MFGRGLAVLCNATAYRSRVTRWFGVVKLRLCRYCYVCAVWYRFRESAYCQGFVKRRVGLVLLRDATVQL